jgi:hypothetical protein
MSIEGEYSNLEVKVAKRFLVPGNMMSKISYDISVRNVGPVATTVS